MMLCIEVFETLTISMETFLIFIVFDVLTSESMTFHCWCIDYSLMILWRNIDVTAKVLMQTLRIITVFIDLVSETLMFHCCFVDDRWWVLGETYFKIIDIFDGNFFDFRSFCCVNIWVTDFSLLLPWWFADDSLKDHWWHYEHLDANVFDQ